MEHRLQAKEIESKLKELSGIAAEVLPELASRLEELGRWIKDIKPGLLTKKKFLMAFLLEVINDAEFCLDLKVLTSLEKQAVLEQMTPPERYWYEVLFYKWFTERDRKFYTWKQKLRAGEFKQDDAGVLKSVATQITSRGGAVIHRYVIDLSMATDIVTSGRVEAPLCIQITSIGNEAFLENKYNKWKETLMDWEISRGLFVSYNPGKNNDGITRVVNTICFNSDHFAEHYHIRSWC